MKRIQLLLAALVIVVTSLAAFGGPAIADDWDWNHDDGFLFFGGDGFSSGLDQEAHSGDVDQSFDVSGTGDNSNQTAGIQGVANTGNAQNQIGVMDAADFADDFFDGANRFFFDEGDGDFEFDDVGASIEVSPTNTTSGDQQVNQAASAFRS